MQFDKRRLIITFSAILSVTVIAILTQISWGGSNINIVSGLLFSWFIPGFALLSIFFPKDLIRLETVILSIITSFIFDILVGTILEIFQFKLNGSGFIISLWLISISLLLINFLRSIFDTYPSDRISLSVIFQSYLFQIKEFAKIIKDAKVNFLMLIVLLSILAYTIVWSFQVNIQAAKVDSKTFTALSIEPATSDIVNNKYNLVIHNQEKKRMFYRLELRRNSIIIAHWDTIVINKSEKKVIELSSSVFYGQTDLLLFVENNDSPYRQVRISR